ncbi:hypothetical protein [Pseudomonas sp. G166]|uniref:hypothetical protein n=1 Tax=Pseudomonas sp. G166 TaxID=3094846 RepID=UPI00300B199B
MSIVQINIGGAANDGTGQTLRSGGQVINDNFTELDQRTTAAQSTADSAAVAASSAGSKADSAQAKADAAIPASQKGQPGGVASLDGSGVVPASQLPSYVDDVLEFASLAAFPATGETGKIYIAINTNSQYRWSGTQYIMLTASPGSTDNVPEGSVNKYWTNARTIASVLTGLVTTNSAVVAAADTILVAVGKLQKQISDAVISLGLKAAKGANSDITSLSALTTALSIAQGGTGADTDSGARTNLGLVPVASASDTTSGRLLTPGWMGLGNQGTQAALTTFLQHVPTGIYRAVGNTTVSSPLNVGAGCMVFAKRYSTNDTFYNVSFNSMGRVFEGWYNGTTITWTEISSGVQVFTNYYESAPTTWTVGGELTFTHGLGTLPKTTQAIAVLTAAVAGYPIGTRVNVSLYVNASAYWGGQITDETTTTIKFRMASAIPLLTSSTGAQQLTPSNSQLIIRAAA